VLLLDEPAAGLSRADKEALSQLLRRIASAGARAAAGRARHGDGDGISDRVSGAGCGLADRSRHAARSAEDPRGARRLPWRRLARLSRAPPAAEGRRFWKWGAGTGYGAEPVLKGIDVRVNADELVAVLGANGGGKSTFMRSLAGLHRPVRGEIALEGENLATLPAHRVVRARHGAGAEGRQVFPELSVLDNIRLGGYLRRTCPRGKSEALLDRWLRERLHQRAGCSQWRATDARARARPDGAARGCCCSMSLRWGCAGGDRRLFASLDRLRSEH